MPRLRLFLALAAFALPPALVRGETPETLPLTRDTLTAALTRDVAAHFNLKGDLQLELLRVGGLPLSAPAGWTVAVIEYPAEPAPSMLLRCELCTDEAKAKPLTVFLRAALWRDAWVVRLPLTVGAAFDPARLDTRRSDLLRERDLVPADAADHTYVFARAVSAGRPLTWHDLARRPLVRKGDLVEVSAVDGLLVVEMKGLALENGAEGETVTVRNLESHKEFPALVTNENHVQIRF